MTEESESKREQVNVEMFVGLVRSVAAAGMAQLGKTTNPLTGNIERSLEQAQYSIAMLEMLKSKTEGNLNQEEENLLDTMLTNLRLNYVQEAKAEQEHASGATEPEAAEEMEKERDDKSAK